MIISNKTYDILKYIGQIFLPALAVLVVALGSPDALNFPYADKISVVIMAIDAFLNTLLQISSTQYYKAQTTETDHKVEDYE